MFLLLWEAHSLLVDHAARGLTRCEDTYMVVGLWGVFWKPWQIHFFRKLNTSSLLQGRICPLSQATAHSVLLDRKIPAENAKNVLKKEFSMPKLDGYCVQIIQERVLSKVGPFQP